MTIEKTDGLAQFNFEVVHIGLNTPDAAEAMAAAKIFEALFGWQIKDGRDSTYAGPWLEMMKGGGRGTHGHIAMAVDDIRGARACLEEKGCVFAEDSVKYDAGGKMIVIYLKDEIAGFAVHLLQR
jgi:2-dehydro-3-deoxyphosphogluconate aldolase/(4S)-4-hydroxy-2-oxoglutarate aldolase